MGMGCVRKGNLLQTARVKIIKKQHFSNAPSGSSNPEDLFFEIKFDAQGKQVMMTAVLISLNKGARQK